MFPGVILHCCFHIGTGWPWLKVLVVIYGPFQGIARREPWGHALPHNLQHSGRFDPPELGHRGVSYGVDGGS